ncbi:hypothetical protein GCM10023325_19920 [Sphingomonas lutea]
MRDGHLIAVDRIGRPGAHRVRCQMGDDLMPVEIEIDPMIGAPPFGAAEQAAVEAARGGKVIDRESEMEGRQAHALTNVSADDATQSIPRSRDCFAAPVPQ